MSIKNLLENWGISVPNDTELAEYLCENEMSKIFYIDKLPLTVSKENYKKFDQVDIFFQEVLERKISKDEFLLIETKYRNFMTKLWLYNKLYVELDVETVNKNIISDVVDSQYEKYLSSLSDGNQELYPMEILEKEILEFWVQIGVRDAAFPIFFFEDYQLLLIPTWSCFLAYQNDPSKQQIVKDIATSEGLFLRKAIEAVDFKN